MPLGGRGGVAPACREPRLRDRRHARGISACQRSEQPSRLDAIDRSGEGGRAAAAKAQPASLFSPAARPPSSLTDRIAYRPETKSGSHTTLRWREPDSNYRFRITRPRFQDRLMSPLPDSPPTEIRANESRHREDAGRLPRNRWFEACSLQRRVCCEPLHGATSVRTQSSSHRRSFRRVAAGSDPA